MRFANFFLFSLLTWPQLLIAQADTVAAELPPPTFGEMFMQMVPLFLAVFFIFYFMVVKPQEKKLKTQQSLLESLKRGETVVTSSGLIGRVAGIEKDHILLEVASNVKMKFEPAHIAKRVESESSEKV